ncbi:unnamed protein product [Microthlaspi erraticum]|uniref:C2H2-type domain-containing protein n=1 Tax=Microthlaspi erraticum TaxID=1685480 RepID=A0A6D2J028_9BRAS|nr:unnamed protein product [Microthlaspi erraticum]
MEQCKERKFVCKFCSKRFACGKSLGGHIRTHMNNENSADSDEEEHSKLKIDENGGQSSYGLRENPKKNKRFVDQREMMALKHQQQQQQHQHQHQHHQQQQQQLLCCRECGKGFVSSKALCGHMASHSEREKIVMDSQSDTEASSSPIRRRSKRVVKHHHHHHNRAAFVVGGGETLMDQSNSASSDASEIEPEQEEMALSLMMLSRDSSSFKKGHNLVVSSLAESSDNNSVILETKSSSGEQLKIFNVEEFCEKNKLGGGVEDNDDSDNSDSGYFRNGPKKLDSDVSVDGFLRNNNNKAVMRSGFNSSPQDKNLNRFRKEWSGSGSGSGSGRSSTKYDLRKSKRGFASHGRKKIKYEFTESVYDSGEHSLETDSCADTNRSVKIHSKSSPVVKKASGGVKKKSKGHECPICFRVFKSGQALGGHKRSHFTGNQEHRTLVIQQHHHHHQVAHDQMHTLIDLNLPAPIDE